MHSLRAVQGQGRESFSFKQDLTHILDGVANGTAAFTSGNWRKKTLNTMWPSRMQGAKDVV